MIIKLVNEYIKIIITALIFKKEENRLNMVRRDIENIRKSHIKILVIKNAITEMKIAD